MSNLIGIVGQTVGGGSKGAGKDLTAKLIQRHLLIKEVERGERSFYDVPNHESLLRDEFEITNSKWKVRRFADLPKEIYCQIYGIPRWHLEDREKKELHRASLISIVEKLRELDPEFWSKALFKNWNSSNNQWIISDIHFKDTEVPYIRQNGGFLIKVVNDRVIHHSDHISERSIDDTVKFDWILNNSKTVEYLESQICEMMNFFQLYY